MLILPLIKWFIVPQTSIPYFRPQISKFLLSQTRTKSNSVLSQTKCGTQGVKDISTILGLRTMGSKSNVQAPTDTKTPSDFFSYAQALGR